MVTHQLPVNDANGTFRYCSSHFKTPPIEIVKAQKQYMTDHLGTIYLDCISNSAHVGHCHPQVVAAAQAQLSKFATAHGFYNEKNSSYIHQLLKSFPDSLSVCFLVNSGSEANDLALRLARNYTKHHDVMVFDDSYHGNLGCLIEISPKIFKKLGLPNRKHVHVLPLPDTYQGIYKEDDPLHCEKYVSDARKLLSSLSADQALSCFISETFVVNCGVIVPPKNYMKQIYETVRDMGGVCIADEVQTGLGRLGEHMWGFQHHGVVPDIVTIGKPLGNGYPMAAVVTTNVIAEALGDYFSTFGGNPVASAVGKAVLEIIANEQLMASGKAVGRTLLEGLRLLKAQHACLGDVRGAGLCVGVEIVEGKGERERRPDPTKAEHIINCLKETHHIVAQCQGPHLNVLVFTPPMCFTQQNARTLVAALDHALSLPYSAHQLEPSLSLGLTSAPITAEALASLEASSEPSTAETELHARKRQRTSYGDID